LLIFKFRSIIFAHIVENREGRLSGPFLVHGDIPPPKVMTKTDLAIVIADLVRKPDLGSILAVVLVPSLLL
jgi:hypothetical protein